MLIKIIDLLGFLVILSAFVIAFGVALQAILAPAESFTPKIIIEILKISYWPIYGEISILDKVHNEECFNEKDDTSNRYDQSCFDLPTHISSYILLMIYVTIASVLLLNLLIAIFR